MSNIGWLIFTFAAAVAGGFILSKMKFPGGAMVGAIICVGALNIVTGNAYMPSPVKIVIKAVAGLLVGMNMTAEMVSNLKKLIRPTAILIVTLLTVCIGAGMLMYSMTDLDIVTALFSLAPGGMTDMTLMTIDMGGDAAIVAVLNVIRLLSVYCISLPVVNFFFKDAKKGNGKAKKKAVGNVTEDKETKQRKMAFSAFIAFIGGGIGYIVGEILDFSTMILVCSMVLAAL